jgi:hypothetical protein
MAKDNLPQAIGSLPVIQLPCAFFSAVLIPFGALLALYAIIFQKGPPRLLLNYHMLVLIFVPVILSWYFTTSILMTHVLDLAQSPSILPKLIENARSFPDEQKLEEQAKWAYRLYGAIIAYRLDGEQVEFYHPSPDDTSAWKAAERSGRQAQIQTAFIRKVTNQFSYLFALYAGTFTATFVAGWVWLLIKLRKHPALGL